MKILSSHFAATCDKYDSPAPNGSFARRCEAARSSEKNSLTAKIFKYALTAALFLLATAFLIGAAAGYWIIVSRSDVPTSGICSYDSTNLLRYYLADESSDQFGKALDGDLGSASATYDGEPHFPIVSKTPIKKFDGYDKALLPLQFADFNSGGDLTQAYFADFGYEYVLLTGFSAGAKISPENIKTSAEILKNQSNYTWIAGVPANAGVYAVRITSLDEVTVVGSSATRSKYGSYIVIYTIAPATATITEAAPLSGSFITENASSAQSAATMSDDSIEGGDGTFIYGVDESGKPLNQGVKVTSLTLGGSSHSVSGYSDSSVGSVKSGLDIVLSDNVKASANHSEADNENFWYTVTASLSGAEAGNYALSNATSLRFRIAPVELNADDIMWCYDGEATNGKTVVYDGSEHGLTALIDETTVSNRYYAKYGNDESVKSAVKSLIDAINGGSAPLTLGVYARSNGNYTAAISPTATTAKNAGIYLFSANVYLGGERSTDVYLTAEATNTLTINAKQITVNYDSDLVYDGKEQKPTFALVGLVGNESMGVTSKVTQDSKEVTPIDVGDYTLTLSASGETYLNYVFGEPTLTRGTSTSHNYKITPKPVDITVTNVSNITYDGEVHAPTATYIDVNGTEVDAVNSITKDGSIINATDVKNAGAYTLTASLKDDTNYVWADTTTTADKTYNWTINKAKATLTTSNVSNITYDGVVHAPTATYIDVNGTEVDAVTEITKDGSKINDAKDVKNAGAYTLTASLKDKTNYVWSDTNKTDDKTYNWTISKATAVLTTSNVSNITYDGVVHAPTATYIDVSGATVNAVTEITKDGSKINDAKDVKNAGAYTLTASLKDKTNYVWSDTNKTDDKTYNWTISKLKITVKATNAEQSATYSGAEPTINTDTTVTLTDNGDSAPSFVSNELSFSVTKETGANVGTYALTPSATANSGYSEYNYDITYLGGTFTINKAALTVTADSVTITYGDEMPTFSVSYSGFVNNETQSVLGGSLVFECDYVKYANVGSYSITPSGLTSGNYAITFKSGTLTVNEKQITATISLSSDSIYVTDYVLSVANPGVAFNGLVNGDTLTVTYTATGSGTTAPTTLDDSTTLGKGVYTVNAVFSGDKADNYKITVTTATLTVEENDGTVTKVSVPEVISGLVYNANNQAGIKHNQANYDDYYTVSGDASATNAGKYTVTFSLKDTTNYVWADSTPDNKTYNWTISKATATLTTSNVSNITYDGVVHAPTATYIDVNGATVDAVTEITKDGSKINDANDVKNAGAYTLTASLVDNTNYVWSDNTTDDKIYEWTISKATATLTTSNVSNITYDGEVHAPTATYIDVNGDTVNAVTKITKDGSKINDANDVKNAGAYTLTASLKDDTNYVWADSTPDDRTYNWTISKANITITLTVTSDTFTYGTEIQESTISYNIEGTNYNNELTISLVLINSGSGNSCELPSVLNAGKYNVSVTVSGDNISNYNVNKGEVNFTVAPLKVKFSGIININYTDEDKTLNAALLKNGLVKSSDDSDIKNLSMPSFASAVARTYDNSVDDSNAYTETKNPQGNITSISGEHGYYKVELDSAFTVGSTYKVTAKLKPGGNYTFEKDYDTIIVKYKTAKIGTAYYTIEDALSATSGDITLAGDSSGPATYVITSFTQLSGYSKNYTLSGRKLLLSYDSNKTAIYETTTSDSSSGIFSVLIIPEQITLTVQSGSTLNVGGVVYSPPNGNREQAITTKRSVIMNLGIIDVYGTLNCYGYIKNNGKHGLIKLNDGSTATDILRIFDFKGGSVTKGFHEKKVFPLAAYTIHNISCETEIHKGATYKAFSGVTTSKLIGSGSNFNEVTATIIGDNNALFKITTGYIRKSAANSLSKPNETELTTITGSNQTEGQLDEILICGTCEDTQFKIDVTVSIETSPNYPIPIGFMAITINDGAMMTLSKSSYKFLPGSRLIVKRNGKLKIDGISLTMYTYNNLLNDDNSYYEGANVKFSSVCCKDKNDALLLISGEFESTSSASVSGKIMSDENGAKIAINGNTSTSVNVPIKTTGSGFTATTTCSISTYYAKGNVLSAADSSIERNLASGTYYSIQLSDGTFAWYSTSANIEFDSRGGSAVSSLTRTVGNGGYTITADDVASEPTKDYYDFGGWYIDDKCTTEAKGQTIFCSTTLYAKWSPTQYTIIFEARYEGCETSGNFVSGQEHNPMKLSYESEDYTLLDASDGDLVFLGWYTDEAFETAIQVISKYTVTDNMTLYARFLPAGTKVYTIKYDLGDSDNDNAPSGLSLPATTVLSTQTGSYKPHDYANDYNNNAEKSYYFLGWYTDTNRTKPYSSLGDLIDPEGNDTIFTLYAKWDKKLELQIQLNVDGTTITVPTGKYYYYNNTPYTIKNWSEKLLKLKDNNISLDFDTQYKHIGFSSVENNIATVNVTKHVNANVDEFTLTVNSKPANPPEAIILVADVRKVIKVTLNMSATVTCKHKPLFIERDYIDDNNFTIKNIKLSGCNWFSKDNSTWSEDGNPTGSNEFYVLSDTTITVTTDYKKCTYNKCGKTYYPTWNYDSTIANADYEHTFKTTTFKITPNGNGNIAVNWSGSES